MVPFNTRKMVWRRDAPPSDLGSTLSRIWRSMSLGGLVSRGQDRVQLPHRARDGVISSHEWLGYLAGPQACAGGEGTVREAMMGAWLSQRIHLGGIVYFLT